MVLKKIIWLIDTTTYTKEIDKELREIKRNYFRIKKHVRHTTLGEHIEPKTRTFSYGLLRIATILTHNGIESEYIHHYDIDDKLNSSAPDLVAFSTVCPTVGLADSLMQKIRAKYPTTQFAIGGPHINVAYKKTQSRYPNFNIYCNRSDIEAAEMIAQKALANPTGEYVNFDLLPYSIKEYQINTCTTLGCSFSCKYCQDNHVCYKEINNDGHLSYLVNHLEARTCVHFCDSVLGGTAQRLLNVCSNISKTNHDFLLSCDMRAEMVNYETVEALKKAGFCEVRLGIETTDSEVLKMNNRSLGKEVFIKAINMLRKHSNIYITMYSVLGLPGSTVQSCDDTARFFSKMLDKKAVDEIKNCIYVPYPKDSVEYNNVHIETDNWANYDRQSFPVYSLPTMTSREIWNAYLKTGRIINKYWMKGQGISDISEISNNTYNEYISSSYAVI